MILLRSACLSAAVLFLARAASAVEPPDDLVIIADGPREVVVTGSRIPAVPADETQPVVKLDSTDLDRGAAASLGAVLQSLPMSAASVRNTNLNNTGDGASRIDLRALTPKRTLVLLNGHRFPNGGIGGDNAVDADSIPMNLIDRVEVLTSGATAIYGADAVAGVVNFITKSQLESLDIGAQEAWTAHGDGRIQRVDLSGGHELMGGDWLFGAQFVRQAGVRQSDRGYSAVPLTVGDASGSRVPYGSDALPGGVFDVPAGNALGLDPGFYTHVASTTGRSAGDYRPVTDGDFFNFAPYSYLQTPNQREELWLMGTQPLSDRVSLHVEALYHHRTSSQSLAPTPFSTFADPAPTLADGNAGVPASNYYNPFGVDIETLLRRFVELPDRVQQQRVDMHRELASLKIRAGSWTLEPAFSYAHSNAAETDGGAIASDSLERALGASGKNAQGQVVCGTPAADGIVPRASIIPDCVPVDVFGGVGSLTPAQVQYLARTLEDHGTNSEQIANLDARGPLGVAWGGAVQWAVGAEWRREQGSYVFDPSRGVGAVGSGGQQDIPEVGYSTREGYLEMRAPLLRDLPGLRSLDLTAGARYADFTSFGGHFTWQGGLHVAPAAPFSGRVSYARVLRAPALSELYVAQGQSIDLRYDPCGNSPSPSQRVNCAANGVPGGSYVQQFNLPYVLQVGGNPQLRPESGDSANVGLEFRPAAAPTLHASLDAYQIRLRDYIESPDSGQLLDECADSGREDVCGLIRRDADGNVVQVSALPRNFGSVLIRGVDLQGAFGLFLHDGVIRFTLLASFLARHDTQLFAGGATLAEAGTYAPEALALPRWRALSHIDYAAGSWRLSYSTQWTGGYQECGEVQFQPTPYCRAIGAVVYHDLGASVGVHGVTLRLGVANLGNRQPPFLNSGNEANTDTETYRLLGRTFYAGLRYQLN